MTPYRSRGRDAADEPLFLRHENGHLSRIAPGGAHDIGCDVACAVIVDDVRVFPRHARVTVEGAHLRVREHVAAPTFVNDVRVDRDLGLPAHDGARIRIGGKTLVVESGAAVEEEYTRQRRQMKNVQWMRPGGTLADVPLVDLLMLFASSKKSGILEIRNELVGTIHLWKGAITHAAINKADLAWRKALYRMFAWTEGHFDLLPPTDAMSDAERFDVNEVLLECLQELDALELQWQELDRRVPDLAVDLVVVQPPAALSKLTPDEQAILRLLEEHRRVGRVLDKSRTSDSEALRIIVGLLDRRFVTVPSAGLVEKE